MIKLLLILFLLVLPTALYAENPVAEDIKVAGEALVKFSTLEICFILFSVIISIAIIWLGRHWLKNRAKRTEAELQISITKLNNERSQIEKDNNTLLKNVETAIEQDRQERLQRQDDYDKKFKEYDQSFNKMSESLLNIIKKQEEQDKYIITLTINNLEVILFDSSQDIRDRFIAFLKLVGLARNSYILKEGYELIQKYDKDFEYVYNEFFKEKFNDIEIIDRKYFHYILNEINTSFYSKRLPVNF